MGDSYDAKLNRRLKTRAGFPFILQNAPIRYVDKISALSARQYELLIEAVACGKGAGPTLLKLKKLGDAATIDLLLRDDPAEVVVREDIQALAQILDECFPGMPAASAIALAESPVMAEALQIAQDLRAALESQNASSDFVLVSLYALIKYVKRNIEDRIQSNPAYLQTVQSSGLVWDGGEPGRQE
jgi:hypothetical protein